MQLHTGLDNMLFDWINFSTTFGMFFGLIPVRVLQSLGTRNSILAGGAVVSLCQLLAAKIVNGDQDLILRNGYVAACCIGGIAGQCACLIFLATL